jgi:hypothetical protein
MALWAACVGADEQTSAVESLRASPHAVDERRCRLDRCEVNARQHSSSVAVAYVVGVVDVAVDVAADAIVARAGAVAVADANSSGSR